MRERKIERSWKGNSPAKKESQKKKPKERERERGIHRENGRKGNKV